MAKRKRFPDTQKPPTKPELIKLRRGEGWERRHARRFKTAMSTEAYLRQWCESNGLNLAVTNSGLHWCVRFPSDEHDKPRYQWWPSTAKCVYKRQWRHGYHVHDIAQLASLIADQEGFE